MTTRGQINSNFYQIVNVDANGNPTSIKSNYLTDIPASGSNQQVQFNDNGNLGADSAFTFNSSTNTLTVTNLNATNISGNITSNVANANYSNFAGTAYSVSGSNVTGTVANATYATTSGSATTAATVTTNAQPNITSVGTLSSLSVTGNVTAQYFSGNGSLLTGIVASNAAYAANADHANVSDTANSVAVANVVGIGNIATINLTGSSSNVLYGNGVFAPGGGGGNTANANYANFAGNVTSSNQPNITTVGTLTGLHVNGATSITGNTDITGDLDIVGNLTFTGNGTINQITGNSGQFFGDAQGIDALYAGIATGYAAVFNPVIQASADANDYVQINFQNINHGNTVSVDYCATADNGDDATYFIDMGIAGSTWDGTQLNSVGTAALPDDGYLYVQGSAGVGNLILGTVGSGTGIKFLAGGPNSGNIVGTFNTSGLNVVANVTAAHFIGEGGNLSNIQGANVTGTIANATYATTAGTVTTNAQPNITSTGTLTNLSVTGNIGFGGNLTGASISNIVIQSNVPAAFATTTSGNIILTPTLGGTQARIYATVNQYAFGLFTHLIYATAPIVGTFYGTANNATTAGTVTTAAQPNITSTGTLTSLSVTGNISGNILISNVSTGTAPFTVTSTTTVANLSVANATYANTSGSATSATTAGTVTTNSQPNITSTGTLTSLNVSGVSNLNSVSNVIITGGSANYVLSTNGSGNLSWVAQTGGGGSTVADFTPSFLLGGM